ncbi:MAG: zinc ribbon domain-containing protein [Thermoguttaceae bacterium]|jgi:putative FmdB family regulatory protein|nr:zinc ribbon domain-containing protein [Thermoguttaceae bacterium]
MPNYEFECTQCGEKFVEKQTFEEHDRHKPIKCPKCGSKATRQRITAAFAKTTKKS